MAGGLGRRLRQLRKEGKKPERERETGEEVDKVYIKEKML